MVSYDTGGCLSKTCNFLCRLLLRELLIGGLGLHVSSHIVTSVINAIELVGR